MILDLARQVVDAVAHIHRHFVVHGDVHIRNFVVTEDNGSSLTIKLIDFELGHILKTSGEPDKIRDESPIPVIYSAPESIEHQDVSFSADVYILCLTFYQLLTKNHDNPWDCMVESPNRCTHLEFLKNSAAQGRDPHLSWEDTGDYNSDFKALICEGLRYDPRKRLSLSDISRRLAVLRGNCTAKRRRTTYDRFQKS
eukprot:TRINITY_DN1939_c0_g1_i1.p1 TRINITY_DN1939_c0_g1~~TRINITY_DN1939_c0_g1_i1.p1  ORF type:complete len:197 (-),score=14.31 TRINITY_DN1939_c0_g1_i1:149-739(-)